MGRRFVRARGRSGAPRRESLWLGFDPASQTITTPDTAVITHALNAAALALRPFTIIRTRLLISIRTDASSSNENQAGAFGMAVVSDQALAIGITAVPTPTTDIGSDLFFVYESLMSDIIFTTSGAGSAGQYYQVDSKAMRRVNDDEDVSIVVENGPAVTGEGARYRVMGRMLIKLH